MDNKTLNAKVRYILVSAWARLIRKGMKCPSCGGNSNTVVDRKWVFTSLQRCSNCYLLYRVPTTPKKEQIKFYQKTYAQGFTTDMPNDDELARLIKTKFRKTPRDYTDYIGLLRALGIPRGAHILEYGCSWGYGAWQLQKAGFEVLAYEISKPRCRYALQKLGVHAFNNIAKIQQKFDVVFSAHVLEHVDSLEQCLSEQWKRVRLGGFLVGVTPNGSSTFQIAKPKNFHRLWGLVHPQLLDEQFLFHRFRDLEIVVSSLPCRNQISSKESFKKADLKRWELFFVVKKARLTF